MATRTFSPVSTLCPLPVSLTRSRGPQLTLSALPSVTLRRRRRCRSDALQSWKLFASEVEKEVTTEETATEVTAEEVEGDVTAEEKAAEVTAEEVEEDVMTPEKEGEAPAEETEELDRSFVPVFSVEELPKGERREVTVDGKQIVVFWYRSEIFACELRSPAEGAFSTGFLTANFTEDYGIVCPGTDSVFSIKTGEILDWYPTNAVLRALIPKDTCRALEVYPVKVAKDTIYVSFKFGNLGGIKSMRSKGGSNTSLEANNVFGLEPRMYFEESGQQTVDVDKTTSTSKLSQLNPVTVLVGTLAVAIVAVSGTAVAIYYESVVGLIVFWVVVFGAVAFYVSQVLGIFDEKQSS